jgi:pectate lyase
MSSRARTYTSAFAVLGALAWLASPSCSGNKVDTSNVTGAGGGDGTDTGGATGGGDTGAGGANGVNGVGGKGVGGSGVGGTLTGTGGNPACSAEPPAAGDLIGWASQPGLDVDGPTTGGGAATPVTVTTAAAFTAAISGMNPGVVYVTGTLNGNFNVGSNKTVVGLCGGTVHGHLGVSRSFNVIVRNLNIIGYGVGNCALDPSFDPAIGCSSGNDAVTIQNGANHVWFDHCDISDGTDGNLDTTSGSDFVTISWTKFHYTPRTDLVGSDNTGTNGHRFSNLIGSADNVPGDVGHLNITWHHDWWADNVNQRMPRSRYGKIHMLNNLFTAVGDSYCSNSGLMATLLVEGNVYSGVRNPLQLGGGDILASTTGAGANLFMNTTGLTTSAGVGFVPPYTYTSDDTATLATAIMAGAGPH